jgi:hypothetical protein
MGNGPQIITLQDIPGALTFLGFRGVTQIRLRKEVNGRVVGEVPASAEVYKLLTDFQGNPSVPMTEFLACQRRLHGQMLDLRAENRNGKRAWDTVYGQAS